jgi:hypothetical protein
MICFERNIYRMRYGTGTYQYLGRYYTLANSIPQSVQGILTLLEPGGALGVFLRFKQKSTFT